jgi:hypothetical protein
MSLPRLLCFQGKQCTDETDSIPPSRERKVEFYLRDCCHVCGVHAGLATPQPLTSWFLTTKTGPKLRVPVFRPSERAYGILRGRGLHELTSTIRARPPETTVDVQVTAKVHMHMAAKYIEFRRTQI